ncbi:2TM domain-containing protein [Arundinibacter roseus]|uniref:2TM domain-containing protein n=1 Tax=Arundinibacter roseus TaxID=2070510 RepID=A0A4R4KN55_9BACT|nr:2TM domain-containing protein [Arundinibacter roseus]TDB67981.1 2TM domain-containing protein [Arundinibacter roseus]
METNRDEYLWKKAQNRAAFKIHARTYLLVNAGLWIVYYFMQLQPWGRNMHPWPIWPMLGWGIGLTSHYFSAYGSIDERSLAEREYQKLLEKKR